MGENHYKTVIAVLAEKIENLEMEVFLLKMRNDALKQENDELKSRGAITNE